MLSILVASVSLVPGVGHLMIGRRGKAAALFVIDFGLVCSLFFLKSNVGYILAFLGYLIVMVPAVIETYTLAQGGVSRFSNSKPYIVVLLLKEGFSALPLLWQSPLFSRRIKIVWSIVVPVLAILYFSFFFFFGIRFLNGVKF